MIINKLFFLLKSLLELEGSINLNEFRPGMFIFNIIQQLVIKIFIFYLVCLDIQNKYEQYKPELIFGAGYGIKSTSVQSMENIDLKEIQLKDGKF